ncbi:MAG TPA: MotA/TolQ/ExbB proton channel family protein [Haliangiales bacterium]|nr:MotA/TolQ/ExbB proton channel family protein [Haliangiales bacterium]
MHFNLLQIWNEMDWMARGVTVTLLVMGVFGLAVTLERWYALARSRGQSRAFAASAAALIDRNDYVGLRALAEKHPASHLAAMLGPAADVYVRQQRGRPYAAVVELVKREVARQHEAAGNDLRRGLGALASIGSVAPFVGLLGTVVGIIAAFGKIAVTGSGGLGSVAGGISEALVVTALGLLIAIPAVLAFNRLSGVADKLHAGLAASAGQFLDHVEFAAPADARAAADDNHGKHARIPAA